MVIHWWLLINLRFTVWPEMMSYPYLFNRGFRLYSDFIYPYTPLLTWVLSVLYKIFGYKLAVVQTFSWSLVLVNDVLIYLMVRRLIKKEWPAFFSVLVYVFLQPFSEGNMVWFDVVVVTPLLTGLYFLTKKNYLWAGMALGMAVMIKQTAGLYIMFGVLYVFYGERKLESLKRFVVFPVLLGISLLGYVLLTNSINEFANWTLVYPFTQWSNFPGYVQMALGSREKVMLILLVLPVMFLRTKNVSDNFLLLLFLIGGLISVYPRFSWFHMQAAIAFLVIIYGVVLAERRYLAPVFGVVLVGVMLFNHRYVWGTDWQKEARFRGEEDIRRAMIISNKVGIDESVFLVGEQSGLYTIANRQPVMPWTDNFGWYLEIPGVQEKILSRWKTEGLNWVIWRESKDGESELGYYQPHLISKWIEANYNKGEMIWEGTYLWERKD